jgi:membrane protein
MRQWLDRFLELRLVREIRDDELFDQAASVAFWLLLSLPAALLAGLSSVSLLGDGLTNDLQEAALEFIDRVFASEADTLKESVTGLFEQRRPGVLSASIATAIFTLSRGFAGLIRGLDSVYDVASGRNFAHTRLLAIGLALGTLVAVAVSTALWALGATVGIPSFVRLVGAFFVLVGWAATIFHVGPNHHTPWRYDLPGALVAAFGWLFLSLAFGWYVRLIGGDGNDVIGAAGALLLALTWLWAACVVLLVGAEVNEITASSAGVIQENRTVVGRIRDRRR